jgi:hypothetical protein
MGAGSFLFHGIKTTIRVYYSYEKTFREKFFVCFGYSGNAFRFNNPVYGR